MMVVLPDPEGAAKIISLPDIIIVITCKDKENYYMKTESFDFGFRNKKMRKAEGGMKNNYELRITRST